MQGYSLIDQTRSTFIWIAWLLPCAFLCPIPAVCQSETAAEFWPDLYAHYQLQKQWRVLAFIGLKKGEEISYQQLEIGINIARQVRPILRSHIENIDPDKEHTLLLAGQYERLQTFQSDEDGNEHRLTLQATPALRISKRFLLTDRNGVEFRWVNGSYSTRYRNKVGALVDLTIRNLGFSPYTSAEALYSGATRSWNEQQYTCGIQWPYKRLVMLETYYQRQNCSTCDPMHLDVGGITMHLFF